MIVTDRHTTRHTHTYTRQGQHNTQAGCSASRTALHSTAQHCHAATPHSTAAHHRTCPFPEPPYSLRKHTTHLCVQAVHLLPDVVHHCLQCCPVRGLSLLVQVVHVQVVRDGHLTAGNGLHTRQHTPEHKHSSSAKPIGVGPWVGTTERKDTLPSPCNASCCLCSRCWRRNSPRPRVLHPLLVCSCRGPAQAKASSARRHRRRCTLPPLLPSPCMPMLLYFSPYAIHPPIPPVADRAYLHEGCPNAPKPMAAAASAPLSRSQITPMPGASWVQANTHTQRPDLLCPISVKHTHLQEGGLAAAVLPNQPVAAPNGQLNGAVLDELIATHAQGEPINLDVTRGGAGRQHTCCWRVSQHRLCVRWGTAQAQAWDVACCCGCGCCAPDSHRQPLTRPPHRRSCQEQSLVEHTAAAVRLRDSRSRAHTRTCDCAGRLVTDQVSLAVRALERHLADRLSEALDAARALQNARGRVVFVVGLFLDRVHAVAAAAGRIRVHCCCQPTAAGVLGQLPDSSGCTRELSGVW